MKAGPISSIGMPNWRRDQRPAAAIRFSHPDKRDGNAGPAVAEMFDRRVSCRRVEFGTRKRRHQFHIVKALGACRILAKRQDQPPDALPRESRIGIHRPDPRGFAGGIQKPRIAPLRLVAAEQGRTPAPAAAPGHRVALMHDEIGAIVDQLGVHPHDRPAGLDLFLGQKRALQFGDGALHHRPHRWNVVLPCQTMGKSGHVCSPFWR